MRITVRYLSPTATKPSRIVARSENGRELIMPFDCSARDPMQDTAEMLVTRPVELVHATRTQKIYRTIEEN